ncbi:universal stress protein [Winogradskyella sp. J14-2]|uniref:universal stress protein n=1 Tax=Winogradskyella sp. J14-2 TaxID=1936080 RepID=UPI0009727642|nr:universal stress protein [Winogradskyella sp. J14-2]APY07789.1 universal stress protein [Winogradskyella sp. J14-2]
MKNILLLTDFSKNSINALHFALKLFSGTNCNFIVLHVEVANSFLTDDLMTTGNKSIYDSLVKTPKNKLKNIVTDLEALSRYEAYNFEMLIDHDVFVDSINQVVASRAIDLIVMGTNGATGAKEVIFGSNTINVIRKVACPTLVIPENFEYRPAEEILLPLDLNNSINGNAFSNLLTFAKTHSKKLHILRIKPNNEVSTEELKDQQYLETYLIGFNYKYHVVNNASMHHVVNAYVQTHSIDLIALLVQRESLFERFFTGSSTTEISKKLRAPLLVFHV